MKKLLITLIVIVAVAAAVLGIFALSSGDPENTQPTNSTVTPQQQDQPVTQVDQAPEETSQSMITAGIKAKQIEFEATEPAYPNLGEKILYQINPDDSTTPELHPADAALWGMVKTLAPTKQVFDMVTIFEVYFDEDYTTLASVEAQDDRNETWLYSINYIAATELEELATTIVHEFAHILALQDDQTTTEVESEGSAADCTNLLVAEGCLNNS